jgi:tetratricopeptide (TPR) repeat protein
MTAKPLPSRTAWKRWLAHATMEPVFPELVGALTDWAARLVAVGDVDALAEILDVEDGAARSQLLQAIIDATTTALPAHAERVLTGLSDAAAERPYGLFIWFYPVWQVADRLAPRCSVVASQRIWMALERYSASISGGTSGSKGGPLPRDQTELQRCLSVSQSKLGDLAVRLGDGAGARGWFEKALAIDQRLASEDPDSAEAQRDLSVSYGQLGQLAVQLGDGAGARGWFEKALAIRERLASADPDSAVAQRDLSVSYGQLGQLAVQLGDGAGARGWFEKALSVQERLASADPDSAVAQRDLAISKVQLSQIEMMDGKPVIARALLGAARSTMQRLVEADPADAQNRDLLSTIEKLLRAIETPA